MRLTRRNALFLGVVGVVLLLSVPVGGYDYPTAGQWDNVTTTGETTQVTTFNASTGVAWEVTITVHEFDNSGQGDPLVLRVYDNDQSTAVVDEEINNTGTYTYRIPHDTGTGVEEGFVEVETSAAVLTGDDDTATTSGLVTYHRQVMTQVSQTPGNVTSPEYESEEFTVDYKAHDGMIDNLSKAENITFDLYLEGNSGTDPSGRYRYVGVYNRTTHKIESENGTFNVTKELNGSNVEDSINFTFTPESHTAPSFGTDKSWILNASVETENGETDWSTGEFNVSKKISVSTQSGVDAEGKPGSVVMFSPDMVLVNDGNVKANARFYGESLSGENTSETIPVENLYIGPNGTSFENATQYQTTTQELASSMNVNEEQEYHNWIDIPKGTQVDSYRGNITIIGEEA